MNIKWLYERDYAFQGSKMAAIADYWTELGYRVFISGYSVGECYEW